MPAQSVFTITPAKTSSSKPLKVGFLDRGEAEAWRKQICKAVAERDDVPIILPLLPLDTRMESTGKEYYYEAEEGDADDVRLPPTLLPAQSPCSPA